ncbi:hypothetical protein EHO59_12845 [Leptospira semungkisensis]|uniref:Lipoprotein n=1 Tax=Leptospira semungkisensis TaxID=2484985 RepID=A0A4R9FQI5_9LEPT|nr:hypothetical protein [Leptospira semungkisensis]TGK00814.1 hypothetical protein EHO59_12845 [Leptospira semungkisensis]
MKLFKNLVLSLAFLSFSFSCQDGCNSEKSSQEVENGVGVLNAETKKSESKEPQILNFKDPSIKGVYDISFSETWAPKLRSESKGAICAEIDPSGGKLKIKFENQDTIYFLNLKPIDETSFQVVFENQEIFKGIFILERNILKGIHVKFFSPSEKINPLIRYDQGNSTGSKFEKPYPLHVKSIDTVIDCEMERAIAGCWESDERNRPWKDCRPPGYNNLKR